MKKDNVNPDHYKNSTSLECIDIEAMGLIFGWRSVLDFCVCNAWQYVWRWKNKNGYEDLKKAKWYVEKANVLCIKHRCPEDVSEIIHRISEYVVDILNNNKEDES